MKEKLIKASGWSYGLFVLQRTSGRSSCRCQTKSRESCNLPSQTVSAAIDLNHLTFSSLFFPSLPILSFPRSSFLLSQHKKLHLHQNKVVFLTSSCLLKMKKKTGPDFWGLLNPKWSHCSQGRKQSPIDIDTNRLLYDPGLKPYELAGSDVSLSFERLFVLFF